MIYGAFGAVDYMASTGCKRIAFLGQMPICLSLIIEEWAMRMLLERTNCQLINLLLKSAIPTIAQTMVPICLKLNRYRCFFLH